eukprot:TRINITY_DN9143_c0_g1_i6.p1 TRINITY_DN9143_c0_g1~~TRINITY_DN9143_c0_g1_i6.p1  ORF type:complete len:125 (+),score=8.66 TRINITY_DN9143_c0_g1_i6:131-505(+)
MGEEPTFTFQQKADTLKSLQKKEYQDLLLKWSLNETLKGTSYTFDQPFHSYDVEQLVKDFIKDPNVQASLPVLATVNGSWTTLSAAKVGRRSCTGLMQAHVACMFFIPLHRYIFGCQILRRRDV